MADTRELPDQAREFVELSKQYVDEEIVQPAKRLGSFAGKGVGAGLVFALGSLLLAAGTLSFARTVVPAGDTWDALAHLGVGLLVAIVAGFLVRKVARGGNDR